MISPTDRQPARPIVRSKSATRLRITAPHPLLTAERQPVDVGPSETNRRRPQRQSLEHVSPAPNAAVEENRDAAVYRFYYFGQRRR